MKKTQHSKTNKTSKKHRKKSTKRAVPLSVQEILHDPVRLIRLLIAGIVILFLIIFLWHLIRSNAKAGYDNNAIEKNIKTIERFDYSNVATVEEEIEALKSTSTSSTKNNSNKVAYQKAFRGNIVLGDSVTEGLSAYGYLPDDIVFSKIGASVATNKDLFTQAASTYPKNAFFAMGMNDMGNFKGKPEEFIKQYQSCLKDFKKTSPKTKIYVCSISHPSSSAIQKKSWLGQYDEFNTEIKAMCKEMKFKYIDVSSIFEKHPEFYEGDGIHASSDYYPYWLQMMADAADLDLEI